MQGMMSGKQATNKKFMPWQLSTTLQLYNIISNTSGYQPPKSSLADIGWTVMYEPPPTEGMKQQSMRRQDKQTSHCLPPSLFRGSNWASPLILWSPLVMDSVTFTPHSKYEKSSVQVRTRFSKVQTFYTLPEPRTGLKVQFCDTTKPWTELWFRTGLCHHYDRLSFTNGIVIWLTSYMCLENLSLKNSAIGFPVSPFLWSPSLCTK